MLQSISTMINWLYSSKGKDMAKNTQIQNMINESTSNEQSSQQQPNYTRFMIGTYLDPVEGWSLGYAPFDPVTKMIGEFKSERCAGDFEVMLERLRIKEVNLGLFSSDPIKAEKKEEIY